METKQRTCASKKTRNAPDNHFKGKAVKPSKSRRYLETQWVET